MVVAEAPVEATVEPTLGVRRGGCHLSGVGSEIIGIVHVASAHLRRSWPAACRSLPTTRPDAPLLLINANEGAGEMTAFPATRSSDGPQMPYKVGLSRRLGIEGGRQSRRTANGSTGWGAVIGVGCWRKRSGHAYASSSVFKARNPGSIKNGSVDPRGGGDELGSRSK